MPAEPSSAAIQHKYWHCKEIFKKAFSNYRSAHNVALENQVLAADAFGKLRSPARRGAAVEHVRSALGISEQCARPPPAFPPVADIPTTETDFRK